MENHQTKLMWCLKDDVKEEVVQVKQKTGRSWEAASQKSAISKEYIKYLFLAAHHRLQILVHYS